MTQETDSLPDYSSLLHQAGSSTLENVPSPNLSAACRAVCAFLNTDGGRVLVGVAKDGQVVGLEYVDSLVSSLRKELAAWLKPSAVPLMHSFGAAGKTILLIEVEKGADSPYTCRGRVYVREGAASRMLSAAQTKALLRDRGDSLG